MIKQVTLGLLLAGVSASALAGHPGDDVTLPAAPMSINVTAPQQHGTWHVALEALYLQVVNADFQYAQTTDNTAANPVIVKNHEVDYDHDWAGHFDVAFDIPGNGRDVLLGYTHFRADENDTTLLGSTGFLADSFLQNTIQGAAGITTGATGNSWERARGRSDDDYNDMDLVFGQKMDFAPSVRVHMFGGLRWANIDNDSRGEYRRVVGANTEELLATIKSDFVGLGPRAGADTKVKLGSGFSVTGRVGVSTLIGRLNQKGSLTFRQIATAGGAVTLNPAGTRIKDDDDMRVIPEVDARIALHYDYAFNATTGLEVELGYQASNYWNVVDQDWVDLYLPNTVNGNNDFGMRGAYVRAEVTIA